MIVYNYDADLEVSDTCVRSSLLSWVELSWRAAQVDDFDYWRTAEKNGHTTRETHTISVTVLKYNINCSVNNFLATYILLHQTTRKLNKRRILNRKNNFRLLKMKTDSAWTQTSPISAAKPAEWHTTTPLSDKVDFKRGDKDSSLWKTEKEEGNGRRMGENGRRGDWEARKVKVSPLLGANTAILKSLLT